MLKKLTIKCYGNPKPSRTIQFKMDNGNVTNLVFDSVTVEKNKDLYTLTYNTKAPMVFKPWHITDLITTIPGVSSYFDVSFSTERFYVAFTDNTIDKLNFDLLNVA